ncbi:MAG: IS1634 family transposase [Thermoplasmata archaeon]
MPAGMRINSERLGALPILNHFLGRLHLPRHLARALPPTEAALAFGKVLGVLLRNLILDRGPVYGTERWVLPFSPYLLDLAPEEVRLLNDDRGGRALDALFDADRASLLNAVVVDAIREFRLDLSELHNDSTSVTFSGEYPEANGGLLRGKLTVALRRSVNNKEHRPDLKQLVWILTVTADGAVPIHYKVADGNTEDSTTHRGTWDTLRTLTGTPDFLYVADCKLATSAAMTYIHQQKGRFLTVLPETRKEEGAFRAWLQDHSPFWQDVPLTREEKAQGETLPQWRTVEAPTRSREGFRILWVWSYEKERRDQATRAETLNKAIRNLEALEKRLQNPRCKIRTREGVVQAAEKARGEVAQRWVDYEIREEELPRFKQEKRGRPGKNTRYRRQTKVRWHVSWQEKREAIAYDANSDGMFPLITNDEKMPGEKLLASYKYQPYLEKRFEQFKTVYKVSPVYLKKVSRIEGLLCLYFLALLIQALIERELRRAMKREKIVSLPVYPEERECRAPTTGKVLKLFEDVQVHRAWQEGQLLHTEQPELDELQRKLVWLLGMPEGAYRAADG